MASISEDSPGVSDEEVVRRARKENRVIVTFDRDYGRLASHRGVFPPAGVLYLRFSPNEPTEAAGYVARLMADGVELQGRFTTGGPGPHTPTNSSVRTELKIRRWGQRPFRISARCSARARVPSVVGLDQYVGVTNKQGWLVHLQPTIQL